MVYTLLRAPFGLNIPHHEAMQHAKEEVPKIMPDINER